MKKSIINLSNQKSWSPDYSPGNSIFPAETDCIQDFRLRSEKCPLYLLKQEHFCNKNALKQLRKPPNIKQTRRMLL